MSLELALQFQSEKSPDQALGSILLGMGFLTREVLEVEIKRHIAKVFQHLMGWENGVFNIEFEKTPLPSLGVLEEGINTEYLLLELARQKDEKSHDLDRELWP
jgi:hypothetical protein